MRYLTNWYERMGFINPKITDDMCNNIDFQSNMISDEINVLLENIQYYKIMFLHGNEVLII